MNGLFKLYTPHGPATATERPTAVTVGVFDGVHRGHQALIRQLSAFNPRLSTLVVTLTAHPSFVLGRRPSEYWLDDPQEHLQMLFDAGADYVAEMPFSREVAQLSACQLARLMHERFGMQALLLGYDGRFGSKADDDFGQLPQLAAALGFGLLHGEPFLVDGTPISSSRIRETLLQGAVGETAHFLGRPYCVHGTVAHGRGVGHTLGFPTANIDLSHSRKMLPKEGVYAVRLSTHDAQRSLFQGMANLGAAPTFGVDKTMLEVHLLDFDGDLYGQAVEVQFIHRLRDIARFDSAEELQAQLGHDIEQTRQWTLR